MNKKTYYMAAGTGLAFFSCMAIQGCDLESMMHFDVPGDVQTAIKVEPNPTLSDAEYVWERWQNWVEMNSEALLRGMEDSKERADMIRNVTAMGVGALGEASNAFPGGALLFSGLSLATGIFLKRPGEDKKVSKEKEESYNAGIEKGQEIAKAVKDLVD